MWANGGDSIVATDTFGEYFNVNADTFINTSLVVNWSSDGESITLTIPEQTRTITATQNGETVLEAETTNVGGNLVFSNSFEAWSNDQAMGQGNVAQLEINLLEIFGTSAGLEPVNDFFSNFFAQCISI